MSIAEIEKLLIYDEGIIKRVLDKKVGDWFFNVYAFWKLEIISSRICKKYPIAPIVLSLSNNFIDVMTK